MKKKTKPIKIEKIVKGMCNKDAVVTDREFWVRLTKDDFGISLSIDDYHIPLDQLGIEIEEKR